MKLPDFSRARVLVVGDVMLDRYWFGDVSRISPEAPVPVVHVKRTEERPGGAANVARNISALLLAMVKDGALHLDFEDEVTKSTVITQGGSVVSDAVKKLLEPAPAAAPAGGQA